MPFSMTKTETGSLGELSFRESFVDTANAQITLAPTVAAAKTGQLTTRTDNDTGVVTMTAGHGFATSDKIDLFWTVSGVAGSRRAMDATVSGNLVTLDGGSGDNLPVNLTNVTAMKPTENDCVVTGNNVKGLGVLAPKGGYVVFRDAGGDITTALFTLRQSVGGGSSWLSSTGETNPVSGKSVTKVSFSHPDSTGPVEMRAVVINN